MSIPHELSNYVSSPDSNYSWQVEPGQHDGQWLRLVSQKWHDVTWTHTVAVVDPHPTKKPRTAAKTAILYITGGEPNPLDLAEAHRLSDLSDLPVALLFDIPVQPIWGLMEDDLIAHTLEKFLETGDATWPLLFPMTKSAIRAMDALQSARGFRRFVVMGASKRGWTTWLAAATGDKRIIGIAPTVYDNLNIPAQMAHQMKFWGHFSPQISSYTDLGLQKTLDSDAGIRLARMIDPYSYLPEVKCPVLVVTGSLDPYWAVDALSQYKSRLPYATSLITLPNQGHVFHEKEPFLKTVGAFAHACSLRKRLPHLAAGFGAGIVNVRFTKTPTIVRLYRAESDSAVFTGSEWKLIEARAPRPRARRVSLGYSASSAKFAAEFVSADFSEVFRDGFHTSFTLTTPVRLIHSKGV